ncbi:hypothetical protein [Nocardia sp. NPDC127526]|uniref:hypothetical protein n=1 Tax=Nocardia sp. NPDC127526 TaxID=3345393 RepID=UPI00363ACA02
MQAVFLIALGVLFFIMGPALAVVIVSAVRRSAREQLAARRPAKATAVRMPVGAHRAVRR